MQVERAKLSGETVLLTGDFNAKLGSLFVPGDVHDKRTNGKHLLDLWKTQYLLLIEHTELYTWRIYTCQQ